MPLDTLIDNAWFVAGRSSEFPVNEPKGLQICGQAGVRINKKPAEAGLLIATQLRAARLNAPRSF